MMGFVDLALTFYHKLSEADMKDYLSQVREEGENLERLISGMLRLFSIESERESWEWKEFPYEPRERPWYEAALEGLVLFVILWWFSSKERPYMAVSGLFLLLYGVFRFYIEFYRVPDAHIGYLLADWVTMGQLLSAPMMLVGAWMLLRAYRNQVTA